MTKLPDNVRGYRSRVLNALLGAARRARILPGPGIRAIPTPGGTILAAIPPRPVPTDREVSERSDPYQKSIERGPHGLQARNFDHEQSYAKINGTIGDWIAADPVTGEITAKEGAQCIEFYVRVTDGTGSEDSHKETKYLRLADPVDDPTDPDDISDQEPDPPPPCGHPGNSATDDQPGFIADHPGDDLAPEDHPANSDITPPSSGVCP